MLRRVKLSRFRFMRASQGDGHGSDHDHRGSMDSRVDALAGGAPGSRLLYHVLQAIAIFMVFWTAWRLTVSGSSCKE